jgi:YD repeat-containing protein
MVLTLMDWNVRNQLIGVSGPGLNASFQYDGLGRRVSKTINGTSSEYLYDRFNPVQELSSGTPTANLLHGQSIDECYTRSDSSGMRSFLTDALGSTLALSDSSGILQTQYTFEPFGKTTTLDSQVPIRINLQGVKMIVAVYIIIVPVITIRRPSGL